MKSINKNIKQIISKTLIVLIWLCLVLGCASHPHFQEVKKSDEMGLVYFYSPKKSFHGGYSHLINANGFKINTLCNGGYFAYMAKPGRIQFSSRSEITSFVTLDVEPGQIYYIKVSDILGNIVSRPHLQLVASDQGETEIVLCKMIGKDRYPNTTIQSKSEKNKKE